MYIGACRITLALPGNRSLKGKRQVLRSVCDKLRHKFHAAAAEVGDPECWSEAEIGFAVVSNSSAHARAMAENVVGYVEEMMIAPVRSAELEIVSFDDVSGGSGCADVEQWGEALTAKIGDDTPEDR